MSRKNRAPIRTIYPDPNYKSITLSKFVNFMMFDGKKKIGRASCRERV